MSAKNVTTMWFYYALPTLCFNTRRSVTTTSPEGETKMFTSIGEAAKELGFSEHGVGETFHEKRNRIGEYEQEWLEPEPNVDPEAAVRIETLKKTFTRTVCVYCNKPLTREDRVEDGFSISKLNEKTGYPMEDHEVKSIYEAHKLTGLSVSSLINAVDKGNAIITRRKDKQQPFYIGKAFTKDASKLGGKKGG